MNLLLQPYRRPREADQDNFLTTVINPFDLQAAVRERPANEKPDLTNFLAKHPTGVAPIWALGNNRSGRSIFDKLDEGDLVLFHGSNVIYAYAHVSAKVHWPRNDFVWPSGSEWDYIYSLRGVTVLPPERHVVRDSLRGTMIPKVGHLSAHFVDLVELGLTPQEILAFINTAPPHVRQPHTPTRSAEQPPILGERFADRTAIWRAFGGQWQQGIVRFAGSDVVNVFSDANGPYPDFEDPESGVIEYRGQGLRGNQSLSYGNKLLEDARLARVPLRFWHRPVNGNWTFKSWVVVEDRLKIEEPDRDGNSAQRLVWILVPVPSPDKDTWQEEARNSSPLDLPQPGLEELLDEGEMKRRYQQFVEEIRQEVSQPPRYSRQVRTYKRRRLARELVLIRANYQCEHDKCGGMPFELGRDNRPILQVDHITPLSESGSDTPDNMIALCPNCHSAKTLGRSADNTARRFRQLVELAERRMQQGDH